MLIERSIDIDRLPSEVFEFVSDSTNDPSWCPKVISVERLDSGPVGVGSSFNVVHKPIPLRPARQMENSILDWVRDEKVVLREDDGYDVFTVTYLFLPSDGGTRFTQRSEAALGAPKLLHPILRVGIGKDITVQLRHLRALLARV